MPQPPAPSRPLGRLRLASVVLLLAVCAVVAIITFRHEPPDPEGQRELAAFLRRAHRNGLPRWITLGTVEFGANVVMFIPIGFLGALVPPGRPWLVVPIAAAGSIAIEVFQAWRLPERVGSVGDVLANTLGASTGFLLAWLLLAHLERRSRRLGAPDPPYRPPQPRTPHR